MEAGAASRRLAGLPRVEVIGFEVPVAETLAARLLGLSLLDAESAGPGLLIPRCTSVHTFGMRFALDLVFLDGEGCVVELRRDVPPWRVACARSADSVLELVPAG